MQTCHVYIIKEDNIDFILVIMMVMPVSLCPNIFSFITLRLNDDKYLSLATVYRILFMILLMMPLSLPYFKSSMINPIFYD
jgi:hypothetical protein